MTALMWDQVGERRFETGVDRGVLYLPDGRAIPWNGLTGVDDSTTSEIQAHYLDGVKFLERQIPGDYEGSLRAFTYPDEFNEVLGIREVHEGLVYHDQIPQRFNLSYRTKIGNDVGGQDLGYRIHLLYNLRAKPAARSFSSIGDSLQLTEFSWDLSGVPKLVSGYRPTVHISIDSTKTDPERLAAIEELLYGTDTADPTLPDISTFSALFQSYDALIITDNGNGTWTASDATGSYISMVDSETFQIDNADVVVIDPDTYEISTTNAD